MGMGFGVGTSPSLLLGDSQSCLLLPALEHLPPASSPCPALAKLNQCNSPVSGAHSGMDRPAQPLLLVYALFGLHMPIYLKANKKHFRMHQDCTQGHIRIVPNLFL